MFKMKPDIKVGGGRKPMWELDEEFTWPGQPTDVDGFTRALIDASRPSSKNHE